MKRSLHESFDLRYSLRHVDRNLTLTMDFSNLLKHCYRFTYASFHTVYNYTWLSAIGSVTVSSAGLR